jgi:hypothetical protein
MLQIAAAKKLIIHGLLQKFDSSGKKVVAG